MRRRDWSMIAALCWLGVAAPGLAAAQPPADAGQARAHFIRGQRAIEVGRWTDAVRDLERAYELSRSPTALFNTGFALRALGRHLEARAAFDRLLEEHPDGPEDLLTEARGLRAEVDGLIVTLAVHGLDRGERYRVRLDGQRRRDSGRRPLSLQLDPGSHALRIELAGFEPFLWESESWGGEQLRVDVDMVRLPEPDEPSIFEQPLFWVFAGVILVAGAIAIGFVIDDASRPNTETNRVVEL